MRNSLLVLALLGVLVTPLGAQTSTETSVVGVPTEPPWVIYIVGDGTHAEWNIPHVSIPRQQWTEIDLAPYDIPADTKAVELRGWFISSGYPAIYCGMVATIRPYGSDHYEWAYQFQAVASTPGGAFRQIETKKVPVRGRKLEFWWYYPYDYSYCPMTMLFTLEAYYR